MATLQRLAKCCAYGEMLKAQAAKKADTGVKELQSRIAGTTMASTIDDMDVHKCTSECSVRTRDNTN